MYLIFDTETTGLPRDWNAPITDTNNWPRVVQIAWQLHDEFGRLIENKDFLIFPDGFDIPYDAEKVHGISTKLAQTFGESITDVIEEFNSVLEKTTFLVGQNVGFDINIIGCEMVRVGLDSKFLSMPILDTCTESTAELVKIPMGRGKYKLPTLTELYNFLFQESFDEAHNATADVEATARCFFELIKLGHYPNEQLQQSIDYLEKFKRIHSEKTSLFGLKHINLKKESAKLIDFPTANSSGSTELIDESNLIDYSFAHLHNHTQFSILQSTITINSLVNKAIEMEMPAVAITDTGNMMGAFQFEKLVSIHNKTIKEHNVKCIENGSGELKKELLPIIGCEFYVCRNRNDKSQKDNGYLVVVLAKNKNGYQNLIKLSSYAYTEGMYYVPRIDKELIIKYKEDLIVLTGNLSGEVPNLILNVGQNQAEEALLWWKEQFGEDLYIEIMRHGQENEDRVNQTLIEFSRKHNVKLVAANNTYYLEKKDAEAHDILLCVKDNELVTTPKGRGRGFRYGLENNEYYFKSQEEMKGLFQDLPDAISSISEIISKCEHYSLSRDVLLPAFDIPAEFQDSQDLLDGGKRGENNYLRHLTFQGALKKYGTLTDEIRERLDFELATIEKTGYPGYFLIVQDFCNAAREMGVSVGPGRGSAAGSAVAYCTGITNVDPIEYDLLFERFLNPDRVSMPDIDIDFDDEGRGRVIEWVINKYGANQVAQIITYGTMAAKSSIRDTARVMDLPLPEADRIAKLVPDLALNKLFSLSEPELAEKLKNNQDDLTKARELRSIYSGSGLSSDVVRQAKQLEGSVRNTGIHACGVIITPDDITNFVPVATAKDSEMFCTQYDNSVAESAGLLKMDFLGLKTLTLIKDAVRNIEITKGIKLDPDKFPKDDFKTYELFQRGETIGIFQYESVGMQKYMRELKPTVFADLIAMNALYRPGPLEYIPSFIKRKHGEEPIVYDLDDCEEFLKETYGITVYQEQVMLLSQKLAGFSKGEADTLRKAMGKKQKDVLDKMRPAFLERGAEKGHNPDKLEKIWKDWEAFASYAFNKSHSTCYAWIAYQTAYLKANYPAEYMASVLSNNMSDIKQVSFFMEECKRMSIPVLGPDVNESDFQFTVNSFGAIRFGLGAIRGMGSSPVEVIVNERNNNGFYHSIFDFSKRVNLRICNRRTFESLAYSGGFDSFKGVHRAQYFKEDNNGRIFIENVIRYGSTYQENINSQQKTIFDSVQDVNIAEPEIPKSNEWGTVYRLNKEKEVVGIFISGHPLDDFRIEMKSFCNGTIAMFNEPQLHKGRDLTIGAVISDAEHRFTKNGDPFGTLTIEDYFDAHKLFLWRENYLKFKHFIQPGTFVALKGRIEVPPRRNELEFVIHSIELLQNLREQKAKSVHLKVPTKAITQALVMDLNKLIIQNEGNCSLHVIVFDQLDEIEVRLNSKSIKVNPSNEFFDGLDKLAIDFEVR
jgi:DNA polymerase-3 subunit alpha